jgi:hypothetical protein
MGRKKGGRGGGRSGGRGGVGEEGVRVDSNKFIL